MSTYSITMSNYHNDAKFVFSVKDQYMKKPQFAQKSKLFLDLELEKIELKYKNGFEKIIIKEDCKKLIGIDINPRKDPRGYFLKKWLARWVKDRNRFMLVDAFDLRGIRFPLTLSL